MKRLCLMLAAVFLFGCLSFAAPLPLPLGNRAYVFADHDRGEERREERREAGREERREHRRHRHHHRRHRDHDHDRDDRGYRYRDNR